MFDNNIKLALLGGDARQMAVARRLAGLGFETAVWGLGHGEEALGGAVRCDRWDDAVSACHAVILPLPASADGVRVNCPMADPESPQRLKLSKLVDALPTGAPILGGRFTPAFKSMADAAGHHAWDYFESEELQIKNAVPTAEGAIAIAMNELPVTLHGANVAVIGYGRVGRTLARMLGALGAHVTVAARKGVDLAWAENCGFRTLRIQVHDGVSSLNVLGQGYDVIFNTVPYWLFDGNVLPGICKSTLIIDLASAPGGVDSRAAGECGVRVIWALSLPGKCSPYTAGNIICDTILDILSREGVVQ